MDECKFNTTLTREIANLKELLFVRIDSIEKAVELAHGNYVRVPTDIQKEVQALKDFLLATIKGEHDLKEVKFAKVEQRFELIESARLEQKEDTKTRVDAALKSQENAFAEQNRSFLVSINKSEESTRRQIEAQGEIITDLKDRLTRSEGQNSGKKDFWGYIVAAVAVAAFLIEHFKT